MFLMCMLTGAIDKDVKAEKVRIGSQRCQE